MIFSVFRKASLSHMKEQVSRLAKPAVVQYVTVFRLILAKRVKHWSRDWDGKASYCELWCGRWRAFGLKQKLLGVKTIRQEQNWCWFLTRPASMCPFQNGSFTSGILNKSTESAKFTCDDLCGEIESYSERVMWWYFARIKCGNIVSGWLWIVLSVPRTWLIVWFPEVVDRQISGMSWRSCYKNIVYKHETSLEVFDAL